MSRVHGDQLAPPSLVSRSRQRAESWIIPAAVTLPAGTGYLRWSWPGLAAAIPVLVLVLFLAWKARLG